VKIAPTTLRIGIHIKSATRKYDRENLVSIILSLGFRKKTTTAATDTTLLIIVVTYTVESGSIILNRGSKEFMKSPISRRKTMLNPTEKSIVSSKPSLFSLSNFISIKPGTNVRYINPNTCLATGIFRKTAT
jgi:hypothetical protein